jgi:hypothetical protein
MKEYKMTKKQIANSRHQQVQKWTYQIVEN